MSQLGDARLDELTPDQSELVETIDAIHLLAWRTQQEDVVFLDATEQMRRRLNDRLRNDEVIYTVAGNAFLPMTLPNGEPHTVFKTSYNIRGTFHSLEFADASAFDYYDNDSLLDLGEAMAEELGYDSDVIEKHPLFQAFAEQLSEPEEGLRLYAFFLIDSERELQQPIAGSCVIAREVDTYAIVDATTMQITGTEKKQPTQESITVLNIQDHLIAASNTVQALTRDTHFRRRLTAAEQAASLGEAISDINQILGPERFMVMVRPDFFYAPSPVDPRELTRYNTPNECGAINFEIISVDSIELQKITEGRRITRNDRQVEDSIGIWLVGSIDEYSKDMLGINTDIIWIPVESGAEPSSRAGRHLSPRRIRHAKPISSFEGVFLEKGLRF